MKPNDERGLGLMSRAAQSVMAEFPEAVLAYGQSDEFSFVFHKHCKLYNRRARWGLGGRGDISTFMSILNTYILAVYEFMYCLEKYSE